MWKQLISRQWVWWIAYFGLLVLLRWSWNWWLVGWLLGGVVGYWFGWLDLLVSSLLLPAQDDAAVDLPQLIALGQLKRIVALLKTNKVRPKHLMGLSLVFLVGWVVIAAFVLTSSVSYFGKGLVMSVGLRACYWMAQEWPPTETLRAQVFWQVQRRMNAVELRRFVVGFWSIFGLLSLLV